MLLFFFFFNDTATTEIYTLSLHDALPIFAFVEVGSQRAGQVAAGGEAQNADAQRIDLPLGRASPDRANGRSEEHTSELQSPCNLVCRLLLEKKKLIVLMKQITILGLTTGK